MGKEWHDAYQWEPDDDREVLAYTHCGDYWMAYVDHGEWISDDGESLDESVYAWAELPDAPTFEYVDGD